MCYSSLFKWWLHLHYEQINSQGQFENKKFEYGKMQKLGFLFIMRPLKSFSPKLLNKILRYCTLGMCHKVCSNGGATFIIGEKIVKDNLNIANLMQTFENLLLQNYST